MPTVYSPPELIVVAKPSSQLHAAPGAVSGAASAKVSGLNALLKSAKLSLEPLFGASEEGVRSSMAASMLRAAPDSADPATFYTVRGEVKNAKKLVADLLNEPSIDGAYVKPGGEPPVYRGAADDAPPEAAPADAAPATTPDFQSRQGYLDPAPGGIDARFAWTKPGGRGDNVRVIDLEWGWNFSHEDLLQNSGGLLDGSNHADTHHGTAVLGEIGGDHNAIGVRGIAPNARLSTISFVGNSSAGAIRKAADRLSAGDIILLEIHRAGPRHNFQGRQDQLGYIAIEWWPDDFAAILYATTKGILVVEAAGNGAENLDDAIYSVRPAGFPSSWRNPFNRSNPQCRAILVGAGAPPPGTHGRNHGADRSRLDFSNHGSAVDVQGWGREVTTTGYGTYYNGGANAQYTDTFSGTSSASPIVVGALACGQGWLRAAGKALMTPLSARNLLRTTGSVQQDEPGRPATQRIGRRPNLRAMHGKLFPKVVKEVKEVEKLQVEKVQKDFEKIKDTKEVEKLQVEKVVKDSDKLKDTKELEKIQKEKDKDLVENINTGQFLLRPAAADAASLEARVEALEAAVASLAQALQLGAAAGAHFIGTGLRPDVEDYAGDADEADDGSSG
jgi:hypothetical protein